MDMDEGMVVKAVEFIDSLGNGDGEGENALEELTSPRKVEILLSM